MNRDLNKLGIDINVTAIHQDPIEYIKKLTANKNFSNDPFYIVDLEDICNKHINWITALPRVEPHYAIKCNTDPMLLKLLAFLGAGFDCASKNEIQTVLDLGVSPDRIIYANPCKQSSYIRYAYNNGINLMTFDNENELYKIKENHPDAKIVLRIITNDKDAVCQFSMKFGADMPTSYKLIDTAIRLEMDIVGVSFHVGSGQMSPTAFSESIQNARQLFDYAEETHDHKMSFLDLGGGYPGAANTDLLFNSIAREINFALDEFFPITKYSHVKVIAEPGRYYACSAFTLCINVIAKRLTQHNITKKSFMYYVNDGVYSSFNCLLYDHVDPRPILIKDVPVDTPTFSSSVWGPTCDGIDVIYEEITLPELQIGDYIAFKDMGAYTLAGACAFNGLPIAKPIYMASTSWNTIKKAFLVTSAEIEQQAQLNTTQLANLLKRALLVSTKLSSRAESCSAEFIPEPIEDYSVDDDNCVF